MKSLITGRNILFVKFVKLFYFSIYFLITNEDALSSFLKFESNERDKLEKKFETFFYLLTCSNVSPNYKYNNSGLLLLFLYVKKIHVLALLWARNRKTDFFSLSGSFGLFMKDGKKWKIKYFRKVKLEVKQGWLKISSSF